MSVSLVWIRLLCRLYSAASRVLSTSATQYRRYLPSAQYRSTDLHFRAKVNYALCMERPKPSRQIYYYISLLYFLLAPAIGIRAC